MGETSDFRPLSALAALRTTDPPRYRKYYEAYLKNKAKGKK